MLGLAIAGGAALGGCDADPHARGDAGPSGHPHLVALTPAEGATVAAVSEPEALLTLVATFDRAMDATRGELTLSDGTSAWALPATRADDGRSVRADLSAWLEPGRSYQVSLVDFVDVAGVAADLTEVLPDERLGFQTSAATEHTAPRVVEAAPVSGAVDVYPASVPEGAAARVRVVVRFDEPMDRTRASVAWGPLGQPAASVVLGSWSSDALVWVGEVVAAPFSGQRPLADLTRYGFDLTSLRDRAGNHVDETVGLERGQLVFTTGSYDALLNHSCGHVFFGPYSTVVASPTAGPSIARADTAHTRYTVTLPGPPHGGFTRFRAVADATVHLFLDGDLPVVVRSEAGEPIATARTATPAACDGISHRVTFPVTADQRLFLDFGPQLEASSHFIVEFVAR